MDEKRGKHQSRAEPERGLLYAPQLVDQNHDHRNRTERKGNHPVPKVVIPICKVRQENQDRCDHPNHKCPVVAQAGELAESDVKKSGTHQEQDIGQDGRQESRQQRCEQAQHQAQGNKQIRQQRRLHPSILFQFTDQECLRPNGHRLDKKRQGDKQSNCPHIELELDLHNCLSHEYVSSYRNLYDEIQTTSKAKFAALHLRLCLHIISYTSTQD